MTDNCALWELVEEMDDEASELRQDGNVGMAEELHIYTAKLREILERPVVVGDSEVRLWDTQWMNIVNHDNCYRDWSKDDAIAHAVKMTEESIARNVADGNLPSRKDALESQDEVK